MLVTLLTRSRSVIVLLMAAVWLVPVADCAAQIGRAGPLAMVRNPTTPVPQDRSFSGAIQLAVDATDTRHGVIAAHEVIPVQADGDMVLLYPEWETGSHAPTVPVASLTGLLVQVDGRRVEWRRDPFDVHSFHVPVATGASQVTLDLQYLTDRGAMSDAMLALPWERVLLYPAGWYARNIPIAASLRVPEAMTIVASLEREASIQSPLGIAQGATRFSTTSLESLVDAPVYAARYSRQIDLAPGNPQAIRLDLLSGDPANLAVTAEELAKLRRLLAQTLHLFGAAPFRHYDAIVLLNDDLGAGGIEHLEEAENDLPARYFLDTSKQLNNRDLISHELVHSWNGRLRQPADLWTPTFNEPVGGSLLWIYEGQTEFWGRVLAARSGLRSRQETLDKLALDAALVANRPGRSWKSLADSTNDAVYMAGHHVGWRDWQRREDYYSEGVLLWLDVEAHLRELTGGKRGLDDFVSRFFHAAGPGAATSTYDFDDVVRGLDAVAHDDWSAFLSRQLETHEDADALAGLARAGWRLVYTAEPTETFSQAEAENGGLDLTYSIGAVVEDSGRIDSVAWDGPAFKAGMVPGMRILKIAGEPFSREFLERAVERTLQTPLRVEISTGSQSIPVEIDYNGGLRYPRLERVDARVDRLTPLLAPR